MSIIVQRLPADNPGPDIYTFLKTPEAQLERGRSEINDENSVKNYDISILGINNFIKPGNTVDVAGDRGMVMSYAIQVQISGNTIKKDVKITTENPIL